MAKQHGTDAKRGKGFAAYLDLLDTADWMRDHMTRQLSVLGTTMTHFRVLDLLQREGPRHLQAISDRFRCSKQNMSWVIEEMVKAGLVRRELPAPPRRVPADAKSGRNYIPRGRRVVPIHLTPAGERELGRILPKHLKMVRDQMENLSDQEQRNYIRLSRKMRGDASA